MPDTTTAQSHIRIRPGDKLTFAEERNPYTVQAVSTDGRWIAATKPFAAQDTVLYTVIDFHVGVRGVDNYYGLGYETREECERAIAMFESGEATYSRRYPPIDLNIVRWERAKRGEVSA